MLCFFVAIKSGFTGQIRILSVVFFALDSCQAASGGHVADAAFATAATTVISPREGNWN